MGEKKRNLTEKIENLKSQKFVSLLTNLLLVPRRIFEWF